MLQGDVPDRKCLELSISGADAAFMLMVELGQADCHLAAAGPGSRDYDKRPGCFDVFIFSVAVFADDMRYIGRVTGNQIMTVYFDAGFLKPFLEEYGAFLTAEFGNDNTADVQLAFFED